MDNFSTASKPKIVSTVELPFCNQNLFELVVTKDLSDKNLIRLAPDMIILPKPTTRISEEFSPKIFFPHEGTTEWEIYYIAVRRSLSSPEKNGSLISVFTSTYNTGIDIYYTYTSLLNQTYTNWEWCIVDDSTDSDTIRYLKRISDHDPRVKVFSNIDKTRGNIGEAKYRAAMMCNGAVLVELDHDDKLEPQCLALIIRACSFYPDCGFYYSDGVEYNPETKESQNYGVGFGMGAAWHYKTSTIEADYLANATNITQRSLRHIVGVPNHVRAWRADIYHQLHGHNRFMRIADDYELILRTFLITRFVRIPQMLYVQKWGGNSQDFSDNRRDIQLRVQCISEYYSKAISKRIKELGFSDPYEGLSFVDAINQDLPVDKLNLTLRIK